MVVRLINEVCSPRAMEEERKYPNDEILLNWHQEFYRPDISNERIYRREPKKLKESIIQSVLEDGK